MAEKMVNFVDGISLTFDPVTGFAINPFTGENCFNTADWRDILITGVGNGILSVFGSIQQAPVDFTLASTITNSYVPVVLADYTTPNTYFSGSVTVAGTSIVELNTNLLTWIGIQRSVNTVDAVLTKTNAQ